MTEQCLTINCVATEEHTTTYRIKHWTAQFYAVLTQWIADRRQHRHNRQTYSGLASLDDSTLKDIGLSRGDVTWAGHLPASENAAAELEIIARRKPRSTREG